MPDPRQRRIAELIEPFRVAPGRRVKLPRDFDPGFTGGMDKGRGQQLLAEGVEMLAELQARLAAQDTYGVLVVLQALDAGGKDGTIKHVMSGVNPQGVSVHSFKQPSAEELDHDFLWRYVRRLPTRGQIGIFNRSHYEEVLVVRVHQEVLDAEKLPRRSNRGDIWKHRYRAINEWERYLTDNGFRIAKLFLNMSKDEQCKRLVKRLDRPDKNWKFSMADIEERERWDDYQVALSEMLTHTSTEWAPWHVIPADRKWFARMSAAAVIVDTLMEINPQFPTLDDQQREELAAARKRLEC